MEKELMKKGPAEAAAATKFDESVFNLSSIVVLAELGGKRMLLTGDARGDDIKQAVSTAKLLKKGKLHVHILKVPHHGSDNNVATDFFRTITADHYVISGNGDYGNPEVATLNMISEARPDDGFTLHLTESEFKEEMGPKITGFFAKEQGSRPQVRRLVPAGRRALAAGGPARPAGLTPPAPTGRRRSGGCRRPRCRRLRRGYGLRSRSGWRARRWSGRSPCPARSCRHCCDPQRWRSRRRLAGKTTLTAPPLSTAAMSASLARARAALPWLAGLLTTAR